MCEDVKTHRGSVPPHLCHHVRLTHHCNVCEMDIKTHIWIYLRMWKKFFFIYKQANVPTILRHANVTELLLILKITLLITQPSARGDNARCQDSFILLAVTGWTELETLTQRFHWLLCSSPAPVSVPFVQFSQCCLRGCYRDHCLGCGMSFYSWEKALTIWLFRLTVARRRSSKLEMMNSQTHAILMRTHGIILNADKHLESYRFPLVCRTLLNSCSYRILSNFYKHCLFCSSLINILRRVLQEQSANCRAKWHDG